MKAIVYTAYGPPEVVRSACPGIRDDRSMSSAPYTIASAFLETIRSVVDEALKQKLHIIINMHHHDALISDPLPAA